MNRTEFYKGYSILIYHTGLPETSPRAMMLVKGMDTIHFNGTVVDDEQAIVGAKQQIDYLEQKDSPDKNDNDWGDGEFEYAG